MNTMIEPLENIFIPNTPPITTVTENLLQEKSTSCIICTEKYSKSIHKPIECQYCKFEACRECCQKYILNETVPKCMSPECNREWTRQFLSSKFTKVWISRDFKKHREDVLFNGERSLMPATQILVENILRKEHLQEDITQIRLQISILYNRINDLQREYYRVGRADNGTNGATEEARAKFVRACPDPECRGFLSSQWKCGICEKWTCPTCHEVKGTERDVEHVCDPNNVATAQLLATDTKPCPKCGEGIFKIDGCSQIWCVLCHTAFDWRTGKIENVIHNPHYYEYMRKQGNGEITRNPLDLPCGQREINHRIATEFVRLFSDHKISKTYEQKAELDEYIRRTGHICQSIVHLRRVEMPRYTFDRLVNNQELRIKYMRNQLAEDKFKILIQQSDKKHQKNREIYQVMQMIHDTATDIMLRFIDVVKQPEWSLDYSIMSEIPPLVEYANTCFREISLTYNSKSPTFNNDLRVVY